MISQEKTDLHIHTSASDGSATPVEVVEEALRKRLKAIAITDHDVIEGIKPALEAAKGTCLEVIPGVEINTEGAGHEVHILGYFINVDNPVFKAQLDFLRNARESRAEKIVRRLQELGIDIEWKRVLEIAGEGSVGRPHIGLAMMEKGYVSSVQEAFQKYVGYGCPAYVPRYKIEPTEAVRIIKSAGGAAVMAHPGLSQRDDLIPELVAAGICGLEVYYPTHTPAQTEYYLNIARQYNLLATGGSDYHGYGPNFRSEMGEITVPYTVAEKLRQFARKT